MQPVIEPVEVRETTEGGMPGVYNGRAHIPRSDGKTYIYTYEDLMSTDYDYVWNRDLDVPEYDVPRRLPDRPTTGLWANPHVAATGWTCIDVYDARAVRNEDPSCNMCDDNIIRWVHVMGHEDHDFVVHAGRICAGYMEGDLDAATARQGAMVAAHRRHVDKQKRAEKRAAKEAESARQRAQEDAEMYVARRRRFIYEGWGTSKNGNLKRVFDGFLVILKKEPEGWAISVKDGGDRWYNYPAPKKWTGQAKRAAWTVLQAIASQ